MSDSDRGDSIDRTERDDYFVETYTRRTAEIKDIGRDVFLDVWDEFYRWELVHCHQLLDELKVHPDTGPPESNQNLHALLNQPLKDADDEMQIEGEFDDAEIYDISGASVVLLVLSNELSAHDFQHCPIYESCTPTSKNLALRGDVLTEKQQLPFIPYADEPEFEAMQYAKDADEFAWQCDWIDPDGTIKAYARVCHLRPSLTQEPIFAEEIIHLEVARRLHFQHGLSFREIDELKIIGLLRRDNSSGLLWDTMQR